MTDHGHGDPKCCCITLTTGMKIIAVLEIIGAITMYSVAANPSKTLPTTWTADQINAQVILWIVEASVQLAFGIAIIVAVIKRTVWSAYSAFALSIIKLIIYAAVFIFGTNQSLQWVPVIIQAVYSYVTWIFTEKVKEEMIARLSSLNE